MLIAHYPLIDDATDVLYDGQSGSDDGPFNGVFVNAPTVRKQGKISTTALFADDNAMSSPGAWVSCPRLSGLSRLAFSAWVYTPESDSSATMYVKMKKGVTYSSNIAVSVSRSSFSASAPGFGGDVDYDISLSGWHLVSVCYSQKGLFAYVDGNRKISVEEGYDSDYGAGDGYFEFAYPIGYAIQDLRIFDRPISECETADLLDANILDIPLGDDPSDMAGDCSDYHRTVSETGLSQEADDPIRGTYSSRLDGDSFAAVTDVPALPGFTVSAWIRLDSASSGSARFVFDQGGLVSISIGADGKPSATIFGTIISSDAAIDTGWHHIAITAKDGDGRLYVDAVQLNNSTSLAIDWPSDPPSVAYIGSDNTGEAGFFIGCMSDVRMYGTAIDAKGIKRIYGELGTVDSYGNAKSYSFVEGSLCPDADSWVDDQTAGTLTSPYMYIEINHKYSWGRDMLIREFSVEAPHTEISKTATAKTITPTSRFLMTLTLEYESGMTAEDKAAFKKGFAVIDETEGFCGSPEIMNSTGIVKAGSIDETEDVTGVEVYSDKIKANSFSEE